MLDRADATRILTACNAYGDFHALPSSAVDLLIDFADIHRYRKPRNANGSRARYFHAYLTRRAQDRPFSGFVVR